VQPSETFGFGYCGLNWYVETLRLGAGPTNPAALRWVAQSVASDFNPWAHGYGSFNWVDETLRLGTWPMNHHGLKSRPNESPRIEIETQ